jgi:hypothetical protein
MSKLQQKKINFEAPVPDFLKAVNTRNRQRVKKQEKSMSDQAAFNI